MSPFVMEQQVLITDAWLFFIWRVSRMVCYNKNKKKNNMNHVALIATHHCHVCRKKFPKCVAHIPSAQQQEEEEKKIPSYGIVLRLIVILTMNTFDKQSN